MVSNDDLARSYIRQAEERIKHAREAFHDGNYPFTMRQCQESVELFLKASLRLVGVEPPKWHDVGTTLKRERERFPEWFRNEIDELASISRILAKERGTSMYGDEETGTPPELIYSKIDGESAIRMCEKVRELVEKLVESL
ncbi:DNA-binding protein [Thermocladium modestius]|uniref:DNA-binding protein n=1 Tax=Thermocladium modestius TaxID=62609 RepID=A0A830GVD3_9CREN|nr:HEPN domain-containing protein [Thermocladium modestius]GGP20330.1 DNA-binding protein [Thermocladium modestius]